jgi:DNA-binding GntR family transcriptional regulator
LEEVIEEAEIRIATEELGQILRERIVREVYVSGQRLREREISEELNVSRGQVRDAFAWLVERRLLVREANVGVTVARLGAEEITQLYELRGAVEGLAARLAAERAPDGAWDELLEEFATKADRLVAEHDIDGYLSLIDRTHLAMVHHAANAVLQDTMAQIYDRLAVLARRSVLLPGRATEGLRLHKQLVAALAARDGENAERIKRANLQGACETLLRFADFVR